MCWTISGGPAGHTSRSQDPDPVVNTGADVGVTPDYPPAEDSDDVSVTNLEVKSDTSPTYLLFQTLLPLFWTLTCMI